MNSVLICPVCGEALEKREKNFVCENRHSFDTAKEGYVNLLMGNRAGGGDNTEMVAARRSFLSGDYYGCLREAMRPLSYGTVLDACCGEGYFTEAVAEKAEWAFAFDLSKDAVKRAAKRIKNVTFFVGNIAAIPIADRSIDVLTHIFAPMHGECARVLKDDGVLFQVVPGKRHLWQMKQALYDKPYENDQASNLPPCFHAVEEIRVADIVTVPHEDLGNLLKMTPYAYKTSEAATKRFLEMPELKTETEFIIYKAIKDRRP